MGYLLFTLYAPMMSFGEVAVGERRMSWPRPGRSAVLGLVAAALGVERGEEERHRRLEAALHYGVRVDAPGRPMLDYHTAQTPRARKGQSFATRREELSGELSTVLSTREWRVDCYFTVVLWPRDGETIDLDDVARALERPHFTLYVGRKSAPLGLPLNPIITQATTFLAALAAREPTALERDVLRHIARDDETLPLIACDLDAAGIPRDFRQERRRDVVSSRKRWQFSDRAEAVFPWDEGAG